MSFVQLQIFAPDTHRPTLHRQIDAALTAARPRWPYPAHCHLMIPPLPPAPSAEGAASAQSAALPQPFTIAALTPITDPGTEQDRLSALAETGTSSIKIIAATSSAALWCATQLADIVIWHSIDTAVRPDRMAIRLYGAFHLPTPSTTSS